MIKLYHFGPAWDLPDPSPFCLKVMAYMTLANIPFESAAGMAALRRSPKSKLPFITDGEKRLGDSTFIIQYLEEAYPNRLASVGDARKQAELHALRRMLEENTYWTLVSSRWLDDDNWAKFTRPQFFGGLVWPLSMLIPGLLRKGLRRTVYGQGTGRHTRKEIDQIACRDLLAVADYLGDRDFLAGESPTTTDASVYAFLHCFVGAPHESVAGDFVRKNIILSNYLQRMLELLGPKFSTPGAAPSS